MESEQTHQLALEVNPQKLFDIRRFSHFFFPLFFVLHFLVVHFQCPRSSNCNEERRVALCVFPLHLVTVCPSVWTLSPSLFAY